MLSPSNPFGICRAGHEKGRSRLHALSGHVDDWHQNALWTVNQQWPVRGRRAHGCNPNGDYLSHLTRGRSGSLRSRAVTPTKDDSNTFVLWRKPIEWLKMHTVSNKLAPLSCSSEYRINQIKEVALNSPNKALAALVQHAESVGNQRRLDRAKAVLPVRILGNDVSGDSYSDLVHTLDVSKAGVRLGGVRRQLEVGCAIVIQYRQHKAEFRVVWIRPVGTGAEQQVGLQADAQRDLWGLDTDGKNRPQVLAPATSNHLSIGA